MGRGSVSEILRSPTDYDLMLAFWSIWPGSPLDFCHSCHLGLSVSIMSTWREFIIRHPRTISVFLYAQLRQWQTICIVKKKNAFWGAWFVPQQHSFTAKVHPFTISISQLFIFFWICKYEAFEQYSWNQIREDFSAVWWRDAVSWGCNPLFQFQISQMLGNTSLWPFSPTGYEIGFKF